MRAKHLALFVAILCGAFFAIRSASSPRLKVSPEIPSIAEVEAGTPQTEVISEVAPAAGPTPAEVATTTSSGAPIPPLNPNRSDDSESSTTQSASVGSSEPSGPTAQAYAKFEGEVSELMDQYRDFEFAPRSGQQEEVIRADDGTYETVFTAAEGTQVHRWFGADGNMRLEEATAQNGTAVRRWYQSDTNQLDVIEFERGDQVAQKKYRPNTQEEYLRLWLDKDTFQQIDY